MDTKRLAQALNTIALGFAEAAEALTESPGLGKPGEVGRADAHSPGVPSASPTDQGHLTICPKHHVPYTEGNYGPYCKQATDDPAWGKQKGDRLWCRITPDNAAEYLRIRAAA